MARRKRGHRGHDASVRACFKRAYHHARGSPQQKVKAAQKECQPAIVRKWARKNPRVRAMLK